MSTLQAKKRKEAKEKARKLVVEDPNAKITKLNKASFDELTDEPFVLVYFYTEKCVFCKDLLPIIESVANKGPHKIAKVDGEKEKEIIYQVPPSCAKRAVTYLRRCRYA